MFRSLGRFGKTYDVINIPKRPRLRGNYLEYPLLVSLSAVGSLASFYAAAKLFTGSHLDNFAQTNIMFCSVLGFSGAVTLAYSGAMVRRHYVRVPKVIDSALHRLNWSGVRRVVDVGCGRGYATIRVHERLKESYPEFYEKVRTNIFLGLQDANTGYNLSTQDERLQDELLCNKNNSEIGVWGIDKSIRQLYHSRNNCRRNQAVVKYINESAEHLPFEDGSIDVLTAFNIYHLLKDTQQVDSLRDVVRVLKPGGQVLIVDPKASTIETILKKYSMWTSMEAFSAYGGSCILGVKKESSSDRDTEPFMNLPFKARRKKRKLRTFELDDESLDSEEIQSQMT